jgi:rod shape-determining protein MreC
VFLISFLVIILQALDVSSFSSIYRGISKTASYSFDVISAPVRFIRNESLRFKSLKSLKAENEQLIEIIKQKDNELESLKVIEYDNEHLKKQIEYFNDIKYETKSGKIILDEQNAYFKTVLIDQGYDDGIEEQFAVLANGFLFGQVIEVWQNSSRVLLVSDSNFKTDIIIPRTNSRGFIRGDNNDGAQLYNMETKDGIMENDIMVTNGMNKNFPSNILIGKIKNNDLNVNLYVDVKDVTYVQIITSIKQKR